MPQINKITVLGSGIMGHGIAQVSAMNGYNVVLRDIEERFLESAMNKIRWSLDKLVEKNKINKQESDKIHGRIKPIVELKEALDDTDLLIEAVPEDLKLKKKVYSEVDQFAQEKTIYSSNTSTLPISEISQLTSRPDRFIGLHFFNPPQLMKLVEVIPGASTAESIVDLGINFVKSLSKDPILCNKDVPGFIVNRIFIPLVHEAAYCLDNDSKSMTQIDSAVKFKMYLPMGIFELADYTGLDVIHRATIEMYSRDKKVVNPHPKIEQLFSSGKYGKKSGDGFYSYGDKNYERVPLSEEEAKQYDPIRILSVAINNAAWLISNGVCTREDVELALKLGMGLKKELFEIGKESGFEKIINTLNQLVGTNGSFYTPDPYLKTIST
ncbi:MAG: 3-hydroxyacyl-CoA dehydrogenase NAD-binding domain-containing protein [Nitrososphaeraceae archaeon]|nr:3-hydroxyacyl-CoA dehydrogenase NAD-binding domain-containing protein [Nitrososphaeraceae archaeon]MDW0138599.1 3-hydroxyacyl-CoA dehydrogenase NAD-binding domain-containing protein [Nitrososphaeraceae archaeon]MDW0145164.1 3-hydroxyacyl-CoA dehydrogenase NAD-binding domain-containing protein [Nitrososphaeraceae archaeon]MDW0153636.1 3-hydroxyacyl-CoA dehydrogenase NAD-binding domain-containing protein [Nitrososphaeraceae archaeon]MDW0166122.1 3-hydroxyacyl-CoA dehydrogenase NAD-binding doma